MSRTVRGARRDADIALRRLLEEIDEGARLVAPGTVGELCEKWFAHASPDWSPSVVLNYRSLLDHRILPKWGTTPLRRLRTVDLDLWYAELRKRGGMKDGKPLTPNTVIRIHAVLRRALAQGVRWGLITRNPAADATLPKQRRTAMAVPGPMEVALLIVEAGKVNESLPVYLRPPRHRGALGRNSCRETTQTVRS
jgi:hypothetical protein